jgi:hypothetical protein
MYLAKRFIRIDAASTRKRLMISETCGDVMHTILKKVIFDLAYLDSMLLAKRQVEPLPFVLAT